MNGEHQSEEDVDPRVKGELDALNRSTDDINRWETEISKERSKFKNLLNDATQQLSVHGKKSGKAIERARNYYETMKEVNQAQSALERAVQNFQKSNGIHRAAKETISLAEQRLSEFNDHKVDSAWQEMLNIQTMRFMQAENDRSRSEKIHQQAALRFECLQKKANKLRRKHKNAIRKTSAYYETKEKLELKLQKQQKRVNDLQQKIKEAKMRYQEALANLEKISFEIHEQRKVASLKLKLADRPDGEGCDVIEDGLARMATQFDLEGPKTYDNIDELEEELEHFEYVDDESSDEEDFSTDEEWSGSSECSERSSTSQRVLSRSSLRDLRRQSSDDAAGWVGRRKTLKKLQPPRQESLPEEDDVFDSKLSRKSSPLRNNTYDTLHGVSTLSTERKKLDEYDIFDDLC